MLKSIAAGLAHHFGSNFEVAIHDTTQGLDSTLAIIENGHVTDRKVGDGASEAVLNALRDKNIQDQYSYILHTKDGRMLKSSTINIRNEDDDIIAVIGLNYDICNLMLANRSLEEFLSTETSRPGAEIIQNNVNDLLEELIEESRLLIGKPVSSMSKEEKTLAIQYLDRKGALLIKKSSGRIADYYGISKYTLYNYLNGPEEEKNGI
jgi:predicted transcriptional regulator YheO